MSTDEVWYSRSSFLLRSLPAVCCGRGPEGSEPFADQDLSGTGRLPVHLDQVREPVTRKGQFLLAVLLGQSSHRRQTRCHPASRVNCGEFARQSSHIVL